MSLRETVLCDYDLTTWQGNKILCGKLKASTCALCSADACDEHLLHPKGGIILRADSVTPGNVQGASQDLIYNSNPSSQITPYPQVGMQTPMLRLQICKGCRTSLSDHDITEALEGVEKQFIACLAAAITAKALETKNPRRP